MSDIENTPPPMPEAPPPPRQDAGSDREASLEARQWAMFAHLSALAGLIIPFGNVLGPLIIWQIKKNEFPFVDDQGKEALNFQITVAIAGLISVVLMLILIGILLIFAVGIAALVFCIIGGIKANEGERYRYPFALRLIK